MRQCAACAQPLRVGAPQHGTYKLDACSLLACSPVCAQIGIACALVGMPTQKRSADDAELAPPDAKAALGVSDERLHDAQRVIRWRRLIADLAETIARDGSTDTDTVIRTLVHIGEPIMAGDVLNELQSLIQQLNALEARIMTPGAAYSFAKVIESAGTTIANMRRFADRATFKRQHPSLFASDSLMNPTAFPRDIVDLVVDFTNSRTLRPTMMQSGPNSLIISAIGREKIYAYNSATGVFQAYDNAGRPLPGFSARQNFNNALTHDIMYDEFVTMWLEAAESYVITAWQKEPVDIKHHDWSFGRAHMDGLGRQMLLVDGPPLNSYRVYNISSKWEASLSGTYAIPVSKHTNAFYGGRRWFVFSQKQMMLELVDERERCLLTIIDFDTITFQQFAFKQAAGRFYRFKIVGKTHLVAVVGYKNVVRRPSIVVYDRKRLPSAGVLPLSEFNGANDVLAGAEYDAAGKIASLSDIGQYGQEWAGLDVPLADFFVDTDRFYIVDQRNTIYTFLLNQLE